MAPSKGVLLAHTDFPLYTVRSLDERHFLVAGGGGQAKTGIANAIEIYELTVTKDGVAGSSIARHDTDKHAVMNSSSFYDGRNHHLATGQDEFCRTYAIKYKVVTPNKADTGTADGAKKRKPEKSSATESSLVADGGDKKQLTFQIEETGCVATDFSSDGGFQKCVRFSPDFRHLATAGADGFLRVWKYPELVKIWEVEAHTNEIDDLDFSPSGTQIMTVSRDKSGCVWHSLDGKKISDLAWTHKTTVPYRFRACRYGLIEGKKDKFNFYTVNIPVTRSAKSPCYISSWDSGKYTLRKAVSAGADMVSAFAVSTDGIYLGVGYISGSVSVYISFSLQRLYHVNEAHSIFVTGVEFLPSSEVAKAITGKQDFNLLSISADNTVRLHQCPERTSFNPVVIILAVALMIFLLFYLMAELGI
ncbi:unnamed protein product [Candidula unifasciata]|uniref:Prolactin regulatory element-binding protein n=1 Tax=Candidula unifasciata TaxID=100452 RepID=A0A8S3YP39_9EUPU|nr:unnamed protein product [Candidula unifasciata]